MTDPLIRLELADGAPQAPLRAVLRRQDAPRATAVHAHGAGQLLGSLRGLLSVTTATGAWVVPATHAIWLPPRQPHGSASHGPFEGWSIYVRAADCAALPSEPRVLRMNGLLRQAVERVAAWGDTPRTPAQERLAAVVLDEIGALEPQSLGVVLPQDARAARIAAAVLADPGDVRTAAAWAAWAGLSTRTLARRFAQETGAAFAQWRQRVRVLRAMERLAEGAPVTAVAIELGYDNVGAFVDMFRRQLGTTPGRYAQGLAVKVQ